MWSGCMFIINYVYCFTVTAILQYLDVWVLQYRHFLEAVGKLSKLPIFEMQQAQGTRRHT